MLSIEKLNVSVGDKKILKDFIARLQDANSSMISSVDFGRRDVQRHPVVAEVLKLYGED